MHFARGGDKSAATLEGAANNKRKEYQAAYSSFLKIVKEELRAAGAPRAEGAAILCEIGRLLHSLNSFPTGESRPNVVTLG